MEKNASRYCFDCHPIFWKDLKTEIENQRFWLHNSRCLKPDWGPWRAVDNHRGRERLPNNQRRCKRYFYQTAKKGMQILNWLWHKFSFPKKKQPVRTLFPKHSIFVCCRFFPLPPLFSRPLPNAEFRSNFFESFCVSGPGFKFDLNPTIHNNHRHYSPSNSVTVTPTCVCLLLLRWFFVRLTRSLATGGRSVVTGSPQFSIEKDSYSGWPNCGSNLLTPN